MINSRLGWEKIDYRKIEMIMAILFFLSLIPIMYCSFFNYATGDDLWEGAVAKQVIANGGDIKEFVQAIWNWAKVDYYGWEGNWSSIILWCLEPSIWGEKVYHITAWIALVSICGGSYYFFRYYLKKYFNAPGNLINITAIIVCFYCIQYMPYVRSGIFWYTGMINYVLPFGLCLASFVWADKFLVSGKKRWLTGVSIIFAYLGGAGYPPIILAFEIMILISFVFMIQNKGLYKRGLFLLIPVFLLVAGFVFSAFSPGNAVRGGETYYFSVQRVVETLMQCLIQGCGGIIDTFVRVRPLFLMVPILSIATWELVDVNNIECKHPVWVTLILFLINCSVYTPQIYAQSEVSGGVPDVIYFVLILLVAIEIIYINGWIKGRIAAKGENISLDIMGKTRIGILIFSVIFCAVFSKFLIGNMTDYICIEYVKSGQLKDFDRQMKERLAILNREDKNVILPEMNDEQGPFMHMAITRNPEAYTNKATARFYGKESVVAIPRDEYYELYGITGDEKE